MSQKKLQSEIDRLLKKVSEGVETFEYIFAKINHTNNNNQKDKYEQDLKKEIKKLQRLRDQIKTWLASNDIKDKRALLENRKLIESQMERFKQIEKEMKTKAYSREGLMQKERLDPKDKEKADACEFVTNAVDELSRQIETVEFEIEQLEGSASKRGNSKKAAERVERLDEMNRLNERRKFHINRLELILRLLENDQLEADSVNDLKEAIQYYVDCNQEPDFEEDEGLYDDLNLEEEELLYAIRTTDEFHPKSESDTEDNQEEEQQQQPVKEEIKPSLNSTNVRSVKEEIDTKPKAETPPKPSTSQPRATTPTTATSASSSVETPTSSSAPKPASKPEVVSAWVEPPKIVNSSKKAKAKEPAKLPAALTDLAPSFESARNRQHDLHYTNQMLDASLQHVPDLIDSEMPKIYQPKNPFNTPTYYPQQPLAIFDNPMLYEKFDIDTLFFIFYYQPGTYQQYLAARELKKQSWRFHKKYSTWFQRHEEPKTITEDYEQGIYIYFDYENAWCQRKKNDFRFEYRYLEDS
ncbi:Putative Potential mRNA deadenylase and CCR4-NOT complex subunit Not5p [Rhizopus microsporus]|nr:Putative Potential mRNA deadenylase and CCR4-NOT complex subunit Not5p [Rhizopus microsporus]